MISVMQKLV